MLTKASMVKLKSGRLGRELTDACLQYWGGMGFMWESSVARAYRDTRLGSIGGGSDEVMLGIISKQMGMLKRYYQSDRLAFLSDLLSLILCHQDLSSSSTSSLDKSFLEGKPSEK